MRQAVPGMKQGPGYPRMPRSLCFGNRRWTEQVIPDCSSTTSLLTLTQVHRPCKTSFSQAVVMQHLSSSVTKPQTLLQHTWCDSLRHVYVSLVSLSLPITGISGFFFLPKCSENRGLKSTETETHCNHQPSPAHVDFPTRVALHT